MPGTVLDPEHAIVNKAMILEFISFYSTPSITITMKTKQIKTKK